MLHSEPNSVPSFMALKGISDYDQAHQWLNICRAYLDTCRQQVRQAEHQLQKAERRVMALAADEQRVEIQR